MPPQIRTCSGGILQDEQNEGAYGRMQEGCSLSCPAALRPPSRPALVSAQGDKGHQWHSNRAQLPPLWFFRGINLPPLRLPRNPRPQTRTLRYSGGTYQQPDSPSTAVNHSRSEISPWSQEAAKQQPSRRHSCNQPLKKQKKRKKPFFNDSSTIFQVKILHR